MAYIRLNDVGSCLLIQLLQVSGTTWLIHFFLNSATNLAEDFQSRSGFFFWAVEQKKTFKQRGHHYGLYCHVTELKLLCRLDLAVAILHQQE